MKRIGIVLAVVVILAAGLVKDGKPLEGDKDNLKFLVENAKTFLKSGLSRLRVLGIAENTDN